MTATRQDHSGSRKDKIITKLNVAGTGPRPGLMPEWRTPHARWSRDMIVVEHREAQTVLDDRGVQLRVVQDRS